MALLWFFAVIIMLALIFVLFFGVVRLLLAYSRAMDRVFHRSPLKAEPGERRARTSAGAGVGAGASAGADPAYPPYHTGPLWRDLARTQVRLLASTTLFAVLYLPVTLFHTLLAALVWVWGLLLDGLARSVHHFWPADRTIPTTCGHCRLDVGRPAFACLECDRVHFDLRPGRLGRSVRRCRCGQQILTGLARSARTQPCCPHCVRPLDAHESENTVLTLGMVGAPGTGRPRLLADLRHALTEAGRRSEDVRVTLSSEDEPVLRATLAHRHRSLELTLVDASAATPEAAAPETERSFEALTGILLVAGAEGVGSGLVGDLADGLESADRCVDLISAAVVCDGRCPEGRSLEALGERFTDPVFLGPFLASEGQDRNLDVRAPEVLRWILAEQPTAFRRLFDPPLSEWNRDERDRAFYKRSRKMLAMPLYVLQVLIGVVLWAGLSFLIVQGFGEALREGATSSG